MVKQKQCTPDYNIITTSHDCEYANRRCWSFGPNHEGAKVYCEKLGKIVIYNYFKEPPCETTKQTTLGDF